MSFCVIYYIVMFQASVEVSWFLLQLEVAYYIHPKQRIVLFNILFSGTNNTLYQILFYLIIQCSRPYVSSFKIQNCIFLVEWTIVSFSLVDFRSICITSSEHTFCSICSPQSTELLTLFSPLVFL